MNLIDGLAKLPGHYDEKYRDGFPHMLTVLPRYQVVTSKVIAAKCGFSMRARASTC